MILLKRINSLLGRIWWLSKFMPSPLHTILHLVKIKQNSNLPAYGTYKGVKFKFYPKDMSAVKEVLVDKEYKFLKNYLMNIQNPIILDIGGNIGTFSMWVLGENPQSQILSLEASPLTFKTLEETVTYAKEKGLAWQCQHGAAWKNNDIISFSSDGESMGHKVTQSGNDNVQGVTLENLVDSHLEQTKALKINILKIDIEGAEEAFLENTDKNKETLEKIECLVIELHPNYCNVDGINTLITASYKHIEPQEDRLSNKPLLYCYN